MAELTSEERILRTLQRKEPDRVPHFEWVVDRRVREALYPGCKSYADFALRMGHDAIIVDLIYKKEKAGAKRWRGIRPTVRGVVMNPVDHPHGGGEGKSGQGNPHPVSPWGWKTKGKKTRKNKRTGGMIVRRRN